MVNTWYIFGLGLSPSLFCLAIVLAIFKRFVHVVYKGLVSSQACFLKIFLQQGTLASVELSVTPPLYQFVGHLDTPYWKMICEQRSIKLILYVVKHSNDVKVWFTAKPFSVQNPSRPLSLIGIFKYSLQVDVQNYKLL